MKRLNIVLLTFALVLGSCDILENQDPRQSRPLDELYNSTENLENALVGAYNDAQSGDALGSSIPLFGEIMGENTSWSGSFEQWAQIASHTMDVSNSQVEAVWNQTYQVINDVNLIIEAIDTGNIDDPEFDANRDRIKGEALFLRAVMHFEAVRFWAEPWGTTPDNSHLGVPVLTSGTQSSEGFENRTRAPVSQVYDRVKTDLNDAIALLEGTGPNAARANEWNARAYLARVNLQQGNFEEVATLTGEVIQSNNYALEGEPQDYFFTPDEEGSSEAVFDIVHTTQDNPGVNNSLSTFYASTDRGGRGDIQVTTNYLDALDNVTPESQENTLPPDYTFQDLRETELFDGGDATLKYEDGTNTDDNAPVVRYPDILLMRAEALAETAPAYNPAGQSGEAIDLLNEVRLRSIRVQNANGGTEDPATYFAYDGTDFTSNEELLDAIYLERRVELAFEGHRKHDLVRRGLDVDGDAPDANNLIWPIPQSELDANGDINQNDGY